NNLHLATHGKLIIAAVQHVFTCCANIIAGSAVVLVELWGDAMLDLYSPGFGRGHPDHQITLGASGGSVKIGFSTTRQDCMNIFDDKSLPAFTQYRIRQQRVVAIDTEQAVQNTAVTDVVAG